MNRLHTIERRGNEYLKHHKISNLGQYLLDVVLFFLLIFNPPIFLGFSFTKFFTILCTLYILFNMKVVNRIFKLNINLRKYVVIQSVFIFYYICVMLINILSFNVNKTTSIQIFANNVVWLISMNIVSIGIMTYAAMKKFSVEDLLRRYIGAGVLQSVIAVICILSPSMKALFNTITARNSSSERITEIMKVTSLFRNYGFASTLFDIFGFAMCSIAACVLLREEKRSNNIINLGVFFFISFAAIINARTSIVLSAITVTLYLFKNIGKNRILYQSFKYKMLFLMALVIAGTFGVVVLLSGGTTSQWIVSGINEIGAFFKGEKTGYFYALSQFLFLPKNLLGTLFGFSLPPEEIIGINSDVGYIRNIWSFGLIGSIIIYGYYLAIFRDSYVIGLKRYKTLTIVLAIMYFVYLIKLNPIIYSMATVIIIPILQYNIHAQRVFKGKQVASKQREEAE